MMQQPAVSLPAQLWIGNNEQLTTNLIAYLQRQFCKYQGCTTCSTCHAIAIGQYHAITWLHPEKQYTLDDLAIIHTTASFALEVNQHHFFIIQKADALTPTTGNSLLKSIEEPPTGYHFMLLTDRPQDLLPTIRSRCVEYVETVSLDHNGHSSLYEFFTTLTPKNPAAFLKEVEYAKLNERDSVALIDQILAHWLTINNKAVAHEDIKTQQKASAVIAVLHKAVLMTPMPGSSGLFWKDLFLTFQELSEPINS